MPPLPSPWLFNLQPAPYPEEQRQATNFRIEIFHPAPSHSDSKPVLLAFLRISQRSTIRALGCFLGLGIPIAVETQHRSMIDERLMSNMSAPRTRIYQDMYRLLNVSMPKVKSSHVSWRARGRIGRRVS
ncbi:hypothetical protein CP532_0203 [Ophiocordyceps camponoti-leonardi (nom. inval.)]|nr:hypothetical protein CP532_0203 [Ophiocordyceps camponoti-leonardi (nom. inval.)]